MMPPLSLLPSPAVGWRWAILSLGWLNEGKAGLTGRTDFGKSSLQALQRFSELFQLLPCREAKKPRNQPKNRKPGILPGNSGRAGQPLALKPSA